jgi:Zn-dependent M28 family amino/carboxypeptidase
VLIGAHLDSWDVGQGAHDDGAGVVEVIEALKVIRSLGVSPKRTIRVVLFTNEENGLAGGRAYAASHPPRFRERHVAAVESDLGGGPPRFWTAQGTDKQMTWLRKAAAPLGMPVGVGGGGSDIKPLGEQGVLRIGFRPDDTHYFDVHHTAADTLDKVDPRALAESTAAIAGLAWQLANAD